MRPEYSNAGEDAVTYSNSHRRRSSENRHSSNTSLYPHFPEAVGFAPAAPVPATDHRRLGRLACQPAGYEHPREEPCQTMTKTGAEARSRPLWWARMVRSTPDWP